MHTGPTPPRAASILPCATLALLAALAVPGCGGDPGDMVKVEAEQQREMNKLLTDDYNQMYRERYAGKSGKSQ